MPDGFTILCEVEPATTPDLRGVRRQVVAFDGITDRFLIPDNHLGRATVSSIAVAHGVTTLGARAVACVNSRDRNRGSDFRPGHLAAGQGVPESALPIRMLRPHSQHIGGVLHT